MSNVGKTLAWMVVLFAIFVIVFLIGRHIGRSEAETIVKERVDTLLIRDTITQYEPIYEEKIKIEKVLIPVIDTIVKNDTIFLSLDREKVVWRDSLCSVYASGIMPRVDSVTHFVTDRIIEKEKTIFVESRKRWGVGVQVGYGMGVSGGRVVGTPYIGVGISYNLLTF